MPNTLKQMVTSAGVIEVLNVAEFAEALYKRNERAIGDLMSANAVDQMVLGAKKKRKSKKDPVIEFNVLDMDAGYGQSTIFSNNDDTYTRVQVPLVEINPNDDIIANIISQIVSKTVSYQMGRVPNSLEDAYEIISCEALENYACPTHVIHVKPNLVIAIDIEEFKVEMMDDGGRIRMAVYTDRVSGWRALEIPMK